MPTAHHPTTLACLALIALAALVAAPPAWAGCGCDHPPPAWGLVMPPFGSPGRTLTVWADGFALEIGQEYKVDFGSGDVMVEAVHTDRLEAELPATVPPGPVEIKVIGPDVDVLYPETLFTAIPPALRIQERTGLFAAREYEAAIGADGTLYLALDVSQVHDPMQFTFALHDLALHFEHDDVVIYNGDGVDLTLFTLHVGDTTEYQWGSYHGWSVESDTGISGTWYAPQAMDGTDPFEMSSVFTYWRHEFHTYANAHLPGGSHELDADGLHPDGTMHIDHDSLIIAIQGVERNSSQPENLSRALPLDPGKQQTDVGWLSIRTEQPIELPLLSTMLGDAVPVVATELEELDAD